MIFPRGDHRLIFGIIKKPLGKLMSSLANQLEEGFVEGIDLSSATVTIAEEKQNTSCKWKSQSPAG